MNREAELRKLQNVVIRCQKCPKLVIYRQEVADRRPKRYLDWDYWTRPLPSFGDPEARVLIVGLAPAAHGGNRTGRMFTGDRSGEWLFQALYQFGFANQSNSIRRDDGFVLKDCYITATIRCAPPQNRPLPEEIENCRPYFLKELDLLDKVKIIVPLGQIAFTQTLKSLRLKGYEVPPLAFGHGRLYQISKQKEPPTPVTNGLKPCPSGRQAFATELRTISLITSYHPSQQNTQTGKLTRSMFHRIFKMVGQKL